MSDNAKTTIITPVAFLSYPHLLKPKAVDPTKDEPMFGAALVFPEGTDLSVIREAINAAAVKKFGATAIAMLKTGKLSSILREDPEDVKEKKYPAGSAFLNARSKTRPGLVFLQADPATNKPMKVAEDQIVDTFYAGSKVRAQLAFYGYDKGLKKGVSCTLANVQSVDHNPETSPRWDGRDAAEDAFEPQGVMAADLSDLEGQS